MISSHLFVIHRSVLLAHESEQVEDFEPLLLIVTPLGSDEAVFGAYISANLAQRNMPGELHPQYWWKIFSKMIVVPPLPKGVSRNKIPYSIRSPFSSDILGRNRSYFGTGESFLFSVAPEKRKFDWVGTRQGAEISLDASLFVAADDHHLIVGSYMLHRLGDVGNYLFRCFPWTCHHLLKRWWSWWVRWDG